MHFAKQLIPQALDAGKVGAYLYNGYWEDIGTIKSFYDAHMDLISIEPKFNLFDASFPLYTHPRFLPGSKVNRGDVSRSILNAGCIIDRAVIKKSIIGLRSVIGAGATIENSLIIGADEYDSSGTISKNKPAMGIGFIKEF